MSKKKEILVNEVEKRGVELLNKANVAVREGFIESGIRPSDLFKPLKDGLVAMKDIGEDRQTGERLIVEDHKERRETVKLCFELLKLLEPEKVSVTVELENKHIYELLPSARGEYGKVG